MRGLTKHLAFAASAPSSVPSEGALESLSRCAFSGVPLGTELDAWAE